MLKFFLENNNFLATFNTCDLHAWAQVYYFDKVKTNSTKKITYKTAYHVLESSFKKDKYGLALGKTKESIKKAIGNEELKKTEINLERIRTAYTQNDEEVFMLSILKIFEQNASNLTRKHQTIDNRQNNFSIKTFNA